MDHMGRNLADTLLSIGVVTVARFCLSIFTLLFIIRHRGFPTAWID
jgi:hypothetical protein